jgi:hypothetical protein
MAATSPVEIVRTRRAGCPDDLRSDHQELPARLYRLRLERPCAESLRQCDGDAADQRRPVDVGLADRFLNRMNAANSEVFVLGPYSGGEFSTGIDTPEQFARLPQNYSGGIWTNEIEAIAPLARR